MIKIPKIGFLSCGFVSYFYSVHYNIIILSYLNRFLKYFITDKSRVPRHAILADGLILTKPILPDRFGTITYKAKKRQTFIRRFLHTIYFLKDIND
jgi:hypothetical protein